ncbi:hypothetical protein EC968_004107 [Mortierella alpina]|nr:hypothetical protein EC968_004107 [Mortierella alpina]
MALHWFIADSPGTDSKPLGILHLAEYSVLTSGPEVSRKSKLAFRLSSPEPIPHQHQHHLFYTETPQSLQRWLSALQFHIAHAVAVAFSLPSPSTGFGLQSRDQRQRHRLGAGAPVGEQSIIDKVLDRLHLEDPTVANANDPTVLNLPPSSSASTAAGLPSAPREATIPYLSSAFLQSHEDNNETWSSTSSMPPQSANTTTNLEHIFSLNQQHLQQQNQLRSESSMDTLSEQSPFGPQPGLSSLDSSYSSSPGYPAGTSLVDQQISSTQDLRRSSQQAVDSQGRTSLQQSRGPSSVNSSLHQHPQSPRVYPLRSSIHSGVSLDNSGASPVTSTAGSPFSSPTLTSQPTSMIGNVQSSNVPQSPRAFYRVLDNISHSKRAESIASSASISTIASSGDVSTINDLASDNGLSTTVTDSSQSKSSGSAGHGASLLGLVTGGKHKKDKERLSSSGTSATSSRSGSAGGGSPGVKLFSPGVCMFSGCTQNSKTCTLHSKKHRPSSPKADKEGEKDKDKQSEKEKDKDKANKYKDAKKLKKLWLGSDKNTSQGSISGTTKIDGSPSSSFGSARGGLSSRSMVSLSRDAEFGINPTATAVPLPSTNLLNLVSPSSRQRSPSVSVVDDALLAAQQQHKASFNSDPIQHSTLVYPVRSQTPLPGAPTQPLPPPPPRASSSASNYRPHAKVKETFSLSRKMGLQMGQDFGAINENALAGTTLDGNFFVANHHRTMQKLHALQPWKSQPTGPLPPPPGKQWSPQNQQAQHHQPQAQAQARASHYPDSQSSQQPNPQTTLYNGGVSRHIIAPDELAMAIEQEAEELRKQQAHEKETQKSRPTSMIRPSYPQCPVSFSLSTVSETPVSTDESFSTPGSTDYSSPREPQDTTRIISCQEQLALAPTNALAIETQRSPISGIMSAPSPVSPLPTSAMPPAVIHPLAASLELATAQSGSSTQSVSSPRSNSVSGGSSISSPASANYLASLSRFKNAHLPAQSPSPTSDYFQAQPSTHPLSPLSASLVSDRSDPLVRSLPPPKRHGNDYKGLSLVDAKVFPREGLPRRSSAAAVVVTTPPASDASGVFAGASHQVAHSNSSTSLRPSYLARRQSSSPVLIRVSDQGGQDISPLLTDGTSRTFSGESPAREVLLRRPGLSPLSSSMSGNSSYSTSSTVGSICSLAPRSMVRANSTQRRESGGDGLEDATVAAVIVQSPMVPALPSEVIAAAQVPETLEAMEASSTSSATGSGPAADPSLVPAVVGQISVSSGGAEIVAALPVVSSRAAVKNVSLPTETFRFPALPTSGGHSKEAGAAHRDGSGRPLSTCSSIGSYGDGTEGDRSGPSSRAESPLLSPSLHAAAMELYPGLRKLSLFTAAVGGHPPPALLDRRKGSSGSGSRDYHQGSTAAGSPSVTTDEEDEDGEGSTDLQHEEDWAGNLKGGKKGINDYSLPLKTAATKTLLQDLRRPSLPFSAPLMRPPQPPRPAAPSPQQQKQQPQQPQQQPQREQSGRTAPLSPMARFTSPPPSASLPPVPAPVSAPLPSAAPASAVSGNASNESVSGSASGSASVPSSPSGALIGAPPAIPKRSPHRSAPTSPSALRSPRSHPPLPPLPTLNANNAGSSLPNQGPNPQYI